MSDDKIIVNIDEDLEDLIPGFLENRVTDIDKLNSAFSENDSETLRSIGHSLKGVGGGYGFMKITEIGAEIESLAKLKDMDKIKCLIEELADYLDRVEIVYQEIP